MEKAKRKRPHETQEGVKGLVAETGQAAGEAERQHFLLETKEGIDGVSGDVGQQEVR